MLSALSRTSRSCSLVDGQPLGCSSSQLGGFTYQTCSCQSDLCNGDNVPSSATPMATKSSVEAVTCYQCDSASSSTCSHPSTAAGTLTCRGASCFYVYGKWVLLVKRDQRRVQLASHIAVSQVDLVSGRLISEISCYHWRASKKKVTLAVDYKWVAIEIKIARC